MAKCLITTLKEAVTDDSLVKLGSFTMHMEHNNDDLTLIEGDVDLEIIGDGYFTNSTGTANYGKTYSFSDRGTSNAWLPPGTYDVAIVNKYDFGWLRIQGSQNITVDLADLKYSTNMYSIHLRGVKHHGSIDDLPASSIRYLDMSNFGFNQATNKVTGTASHFTNPLLDVFAADATDIHANLSDFVKWKAQLYKLNLWRTNTTGDISVLSQCSVLRNLNLNDTKVTGNVSALSNLPISDYLGLARTGVTGNISAFAGMTNLANLAIDNTALTGDTSSLANFTHLISFTYANTAITGTWPLT